MKSRASALLPAAVFCLSLGLLDGCAIDRPCTEGGDLSGYETIKGNKQCVQRPAKDGRYRNDGKFMQWHPNGVLAVEGEFRDGQKHGTWVEYNTSGKPIRERYYEYGIEKTRVK